MRKIVFTCDICGSERKNSDAWIMCWTTEKETRLTIAQWTLNLQNRDGDDIRHICSPGCQMKLLTRFFDRAKGTEIERRIKPDTPKKESDEDEDDDDGY